MPQSVICSPRYRIIAMLGIQQKVGDWLANYLTKPSKHYEQFSTISEQQLTATLQPADLLLVDGNSRVSTAIKYCTQSSWSHIAIYIGSGARHRDKNRHPLLEVSLVSGVTTVPLSTYRGYNLRICHPAGLTEEDRDKVVQYAVDRIGFKYDTKNIIDLVRYLIPTPPVPTRFRRKLKEFGSGDPTKAICSTLVAQAFQSVDYPILPYIAPVAGQQRESTRYDMMLEKRHYSHFTPRDFDLSPYFKIVKPTLESGFHYKSLQWSKP